MALALFVGLAASADSTGLTPASCAKFSSELGVSRHEISKALSALKGAGLIRPATKGPAKRGEAEIIQVIMPAGLISKPAAKPVVSPIVQPKPAPIRIDQPQPASSLSFHPQAYQVVKAYRDVKAKGLMNGPAYDAAMSAVSALLTAGYLPEELIAAGAAHARANEGEAAKYRLQCAAFYGDGAWLDFRPKQAEIRTNQSWNELAAAFARKK